MMQPASVLSWNRSKEQQTNEEAEKRKEAESHVNDVS